jgi:hypothetical protein
MDFAVLSINDGEIGGDAGGIIIRRTAEAEHDYDMVEVDFLSSIGYVRVTFNVASAAALGAALAKIAGNPAYGVEEAAS